MSDRNRAVAFHGINNMQVDTLDFPKLEMPDGRKAPHGVILKIVAANICGSDLHIYRGSFPVPDGMVMGHEMTGEVIEVGEDVEFLHEGDLVSVPFNVACGRCRNCRAGRTDVCETANPKLACAAYGFNLGDFQGGQADYLFVPYADFQLLRFPDKDQAMEKILELAVLSDILPTALQLVEPVGWEDVVSFHVDHGLPRWCGAGGPLRRRRGPAPGRFLHHRGRPRPEAARAGSQSWLRDRSICPRTCL